MCLWCCHGSHSICEKLLHGLGFVSCLWILYLCQLQVNISSLLFSIFYSLCCSLTSPILVDLVSIEQFSSAYGFLLACQGVGNLVGPPFAGWLYDYSKKWFLTFGLAGLFIGRFLHSLLTVIGIFCFQQYPVCCLSSFHQLLCSGDICVK